jgi:hypothetical protein
LERLLFFGEIRLIVIIDGFAKSRFSATEVTEDSEKYHIFQDVNSVISVSSVAKIALLQLRHYYTT